MMIKAQKKFKKDRTILKSCFFFIVIIIIAIIGLTIYFVNWYNDAIFSPNSSSTDQVLFEVKEGDTLNTIAQTLQDQGLVKSALALKIYIKKDSVSTDIKVGKYSISKNLTVPQLIAIIETSSLKKSTTVTLREGTNYEGNAEIINSQFAQLGLGVQFDKTKFLDICTNPDKYTFQDSVQTFLNKYKPKGKSLRGFLFPDTYNFDIDTTSQQVIEILITNFQKRLTENNIDPTKITASQKELSNLYDAITLASILQKESGRLSDTALISGIFHNRLADNYPLQSDVTINFALHNSNPEISVDDTKVDSPYNTYLHTGLPPTPINDPGIGAIVAAIKPQKTDYFYFLYDKKGVPYFAVTYTQHQRNIYNHL